MGSKYISLAFDLFNTSMHIKRKGNTLLTMCINIKWDKGAFGIWLGWRNFWTELHLLAYCLLLKH